MSTLSLPFIDPPFAGKDVLRDQPQALHLFSALMAKPWDLARLTLPSTEHTADKRARATAGGERAYQSAVVAFMFDHLLQHPQPYILLYSPDATLFRTTAQWLDGNNRLLMLNAAERTCVTTTGAKLVHLGARPAGVHWAEHVSLVVADGLDPAAETALLDAHRRQHEQSDDAVTRCLVVAADSPPQPSSGSIADETNAMLACVIYGDEER